MAEGAAGVDREIDDQVSHQKALSALSSVQLGGNSKEVGRQCRQLVVPQQTRHACHPEVLRRGKDHTNMYDTLLGRLSAAILPRAACPLQGRSQEQSRLFLVPVQGWH